MKSLCMYIIFLLNGCCTFPSNNGVLFFPERLPFAMVDENYNVKIINSGVNVSRLWVKDHDPYYGLVRLDNGLILKSYNPNSNWIIEIYGIPKKAGVVTFTIEGFTSGTQCPGFDFEKTFTITTVEPGQKSSPQNITTVNNTSITKACG